MQLTRRGTEPETEEQKGIVFPRQGVIDLPSRQINDFSKKGNRKKLSQWPDLLRGHALAEGAHEAHQGLRGLGNAKVRPRGEMEVADGPHGVPSHHPELGDVPVGEEGLVHDGHLNVAPGLVTKLQALFC